MSQDKLTLDEICLIGQQLLKDFEPVQISELKQQVLPIVKTLDAGVYGGGITEEAVRRTIVEALNEVMALPEGTWTIPPQPVNFGGVEERAVYGDRLALTFRLQWDHPTFQSVLTVGSHILADDRKSMTGR